MHLRLFIPIISVILFTSCKKEDPVPAAPSGPQITITNPIANTHYSQGEDITITADISDDKQIYIITIKIINLFDDSVIYAPAEIHMHQTNYTLNTSYNITDLSTTTYRIIINVSDFDGNNSQSTVDVSIN